MMEEWSHRLKKNMKREPRIKIEIDHPAPQFAQDRIWDFFNYWNPNVMGIKEFAMSLYLQGLSDGFQVGEKFTKNRLGRKIK